MKQKLKEWARRYIPSEIFALVGALIGGYIGFVLLDNPVIGAYLATIGDTIAYYSIHYLREHNSHGKHVLALKNMFGEFALAEVLDVIVVRPLMMFIGNIWFGPYYGTVFGKIAADILFYVPTITLYELRKKKMRRLSQKEVVDFRKRVYDHYETQGRPFPWRETTDPYKIFVSEIMLQQTQTNRAVEKYHEFLTAFPSINHLAEASLGDVLKVWQGLGYNRRAKYVHACAKDIVEEFDGTFPKTPEELITLPGIGPYTSASIAAFAFNYPSLVIDTNVRTVLIHEFLNDKNDVSDADLLPLVEQVLDVENPNKWYNALFDYGVKIKKEVGNITKQSKHYQKQNTFKGSLRQLRGKVLKAVTSEESISMKKLKELCNDARFDKVITDLKKEGFIREEKNTIKLS